LKLLIGGSPSKFFHLREFGESLKKFGVDNKIVIDTEIYAGFPSRKISDWFDDGRKFNNLIKEFKPDAVLVDRQTNFGLAAIKNKIPLLVHLRGDYWSESEMAKNTLYKYPPKRTVIWFKERIANNCFKNARMILPICRYLEDITKQHYPTSQTDVMYQGIDPTHWHEEDGMNLKHPCVGLLQSAIIWGKAQEMLILKNTIKNMPDITFYWAGDGPYREKILSALKKFENFKWLGSLEYPHSVRQYLSEIDVYALISGLDMSPLTLQEAQLMKKPVIATNVGGIPELMKDKQTGFLIKKGDHEDLTDKIAFLLNDENNRRAMGYAGRTFVENNFSWKIITERFVKTISNFI